MNLEVHGQERAARRGAVRRGEAVLLSRCRSCIDSWRPCCDDKTTRRRRGRCVYDARHRVYTRLSAVYINNTNTSTHASIHKCAQSERKHCRHSPVTRHMVKRHYTVSIRLAGLL